MPDRREVMTQTDRELVAWASDIEDGLTEWEVEFVESLNRWLEDRGALTDKQRSTLERIVEKKG